MQLIRFVTKWGSQGNANGQFYGPEGVAVDSEGCVYVTNGNNRRVQKFTPDGTSFSSGPLIQPLLPFHEPSQSIITSI
jgi:DNA-binding beta-propeller fold protein YncE